MSESLHHPETGEYLGEIVEAEDGAMVLVDPAGEVRAAATPDGQVLDHTPYELDTGDDYPAPGQAEPQQTYGESIGMPSLEERQQAEAEAHQAFMRDIHLQTNHAESQLGRELSSREQRLIAEQVRNDLDSGRTMDIPLAVHRLAEQGHIKETDTLQGRIDHAVEIMEEGFNEAAGREPDDHRARQAETYDTSTHNGKVDSVLDRLAGFEDVSERSHVGDEL